MLAKRLYQLEVGSFLVSFIVFCLWGIGYYRFGLDNSVPLYVTFYLSLGMGLVFLFALWSMRIGLRTRARRLRVRLLISFSIMLLLASSICGEAILIVMAVRAVNGYPQQWL